MSNSIKGNCPFCGKSLEIPAELEEFSCLYCGERSRTSVLTAQADYDETALIELARELPQTVTRYPDYYKKITKKDYVSAFSAYESENESLLSKMDVCICNDPHGVDAAVQTVCREFLDALDAYMQTKQNRANIFFEVKVVLALFLTPLVKKLHLRSAEAFCKTLHAQWMERWKKEAWTAGDYQIICDGFQKRKLCFITTATCLHEGKRDDCAELTAFRAFRDGWLTQNGGTELIEHYYRIAPSIVTAIDHCDDAQACYREIRTRWLTPCEAALQRGENVHCREIYTDMVQTLKKRYLQ